METREKVTLAVILLVMGGLVAHLFWSMNHLTQERVNSERCWVLGGEYKDGSCEMPEDLRTNEAKVCEALDGNFVIRKNEDTGLTATTCYSGVGKVMELPDLTDRKVVDNGDGTVYLYYVDPKHGIYGKEEVK